LQAARKPDSVLDDHSSRRRVTAPLQQPTRKFRQPGRSQTKLSCLSASGRYAGARWRVRAPSLPIWSCSVWGLPCGVHCWPSGALLPHLFTLTPGGLPGLACAMPSVRGRYIFCCTGRLCALKRKSRTLSGTLPCGVRTFLPLPTRWPGSTGRGRRRSSSRLLCQCIADAVNAVQLLCDAAIRRCRPLQQPAMQARADEGDDEHGRDGNRPHCNPEDAMRSCKVAGDGKVFTMPEIPEAHSHNFGHAQVCCRA